MKWLEVGFGPFSRLDGWVLGVDWNELHFSSALVIRDAYLLALPRCASPTPRLSSEWVDVTSGFGNLSHVNTDLIIGVAVFPTPTCV